MPAGGAAVSATFAKPTFTVKMYTSTQQLTVDAGTTFSAWVWDNPDYNSNSYWTLTRADGTSQRANVESLGEIENGDVYELIAAMNLGSTVVLEVYGPCDVDELTFAEWCSGFEFFSGSLTVHHTVDGEDADFVLTRTKYRLSDFANGAKWSVDGEAVNMNYSVPLTKTAYRTMPTFTVKVSGTARQYTEDAGTTFSDWVDINIINDTIVIVAAKGYELKTVTTGGHGGAAWGTTDTGANDYTCAYFTMPATMSLSRQMRGGCIP